MVVALALYVIHESYPDSPIGEFIPAIILQQSLVVGVLVFAAGFVLRILDKGAKVVAKNRCSVCRTPVPHGAIYCREHLRTILHDEVDRTHATRR